MTNSTSEIWTINGYGLNKYSRNISSWGGSRQGAIARTLGTVELPNVDGALVSPGSYGPRTIELRGWVLGANVDGVGSGVQLFRDNWRELRNAFVSPGTNGLLSVQKRVVTGESTITVQANAYLADGLEPEMTTPARAEWAANIVLPSTFFTKPEAAIALTAKNAWQTIEIPGDESADFIVDVVGDATEFKLDFGMLGQAVSKSLSIPGATSGFKMKTREKTLMAGTKQINGRARFTGGRFWKMPPGTRYVRFNTMSGTPTVTITPIARYW